jgi:hypothetical protein
LKEEEQEVIEIEDGGVEDKDNGDEEGDYELRGVPMKLKQEETESSTRSTQAIQGVCEC